MCRKKDIEAFYDHYPVRRKDWMRCWFGVFLSVIESPVVDRGRRWRFAKRTDEGYPVVRIESERRALQVDIAHVSLIEFIIVER